MIREVERVGMNTRVIFVGQSLSILDWLLTRHDIEVCAVFVPPLQKDTLSGWFTRCAQRGVRVFFEATPQDVIERMPPAIDLGVCAHFEPLSAPTLTSTRLGFINIHPAPLPEYAGRYPLIELTRSAARESGVSIHWMSERVDQGDLIAIERFAVSPLDGPVELEVKAEHLARRVLSEIWASIIDGYAPRISQSPRPLTKSSRCIPCPTQAQSGVDLWRMIRAYGPYGGLGLWHPSTARVVRLKEASLYPVISRGTSSSSLSANLGSSSLAPSDSAPYFTVIEVSEHEVSLTLNPLPPLMTVHDHAMHPTSPTTLPITSRDPTSSSWVLKVTGYYHSEEGKICSSLDEDATSINFRDLIASGERLITLPPERRLYLP